MDDRAAICWLHRRAGFGITSTDLDAAIARGPAAEIERLLAAGPGDVSFVDPWNDADLPLTPKDRTESMQAINTWLDHMITTKTPLLDRIAWMWHGHFVSALDKVKVGRLMVNQLRLFRTSGLGSFAPLLRAVTIDPAMLVYLDGATSTGDHPNENYSREAMELFTIGLGAYTEDDVKAGASALSGWTVVRTDGTSMFRPRRHDDSAKTYLGTSGVHDVDSWLAAIMASKALSGSIAGTVAGELLGSSDPAVVGGLATAFSSSSFDITTLVRATLQAGVAGSSQPIVLGPVAWLAIAQRVTAAVIAPKLRLVGLRAAGQIPMLPPNVAGWPGGAAWFGSSTVVARAGLAAHVAAAAPADNPARAAADRGDLAALAAALSLPADFGPATTAALAAASPGVPRLALALCAPEFVIA